MLFQNIISTLPFTQWLWHDKENKRLLWFSAAVMVVSFTYLKIMYPFPNFMPPDSYSYLDAAYKNEFINQWPIGYSKFLRLVSNFSRSHVFLVVMQYLLLQVSLLYFLFTIKYLLSPGIWMFRMLLVASIGCPLLPHIANFVSSDCLFTALSLVWFTQLLWILSKPTLTLFLYHAGVLLLCFMVRFNAIYYPFISIAIILIAQIHKKTKWLGIGSIAFLLLIFIGRTQYEYHKTNGTVQYSPFGGWQIAANALYGYAHATLDSSTSVPLRYKNLHAIVNQHMKSLRRVPDFLRPDYNIGVYYLWDFKSPLVVYRDQRWKNDSTASYFKKWASMGPLYARYGRYLIKQHPIPFIKHYLWPNLMNYFAPPTGFLRYYNLNNDHVEKTAVTWFGWNNNKIHTYFKNKEIKISNFFTIALAIINIAFMLSFLAFSALGGLKKAIPYNKRILGLALVVWFTNMVFSVVAAPIELRYQLFPMIITFCFMWLLVGFIIAESRQKQFEVNVYPAGKPAEPQIQ